VDWFPEKEAPLATGLISMAMVFGILLSNGIVPQIFDDADDIPYMNITLFVPTVAAFICCLVFVRDDVPPTPPTNSANVEKQTHLSYKSK